MDRNFERYEFDLAMWDSTEGELCMITPISCNVVGFPVTPVTDTVESRNSYSNQDLLPRIYKHLNFVPILNLLGGCFWKRNTNSESSDIFLKTLNQD